MSYERFIKDRLVKRQRPDLRQIAAQLKRAHKDLRTADAVTAVDPTWAFTICYHAMVRASKAMMFAKGYLPTAQRSHKTIIEFTRLILGEEYDHLVDRFNRMRRRRHDFIYDSVNNINSAEVKSSIKIARKLVNRIIELVAQEDPQKDLFTKGT